MIEEYEKFAVNHNARIFIERYGDKFSKIVCFELDFYHRACTGGRFKTDFTEEWTEVAGSWVSMLPKVLEWDKYTIVKTSPTGAFYSESYNAISNNAHIPDGELEDYLETVNDASIYRNL